MATPLPLQACGTADVSPELDQLPDELLLQCLARVPKHCHPRLQAVSLRFKDLVKSKEFESFRQEEDLLEEWVYVLGGVQGLQRRHIGEVYDPRTNTWWALHGSGIILGESVFDLSCAVVKKNLFVLGGFQCLTRIPTSTPDMVAVYDPLSGSWSSTAAMCSVREGFACAVIGSNIYAAGGICRDSKTASQRRANSAEVYLPELDTWQLIASMHEGRSCCKGAAVDGKFYVIGGYGEHVVLQSVEVYDPANGKWTFAHQMAEPWLVSGCAAIGHKIYMVGSIIHPMEERLEDILAVYDTREDSWQFLGQIPVEGLLHYKCGMLWGCAVTAVGGKVYCLGGSSHYDGGGLDCVLVYDPEAEGEKWSRAANMQVRRHGLACGIVRA